MNKTLRATMVVLALVAVVALAVPGCSFSFTVKSTPTEDVACVCADGIAGTDVWCADCDVGYIGGKKATTCNGCFSAAIGGPACSACAIN